MGFVGPFFDPKHNRTLRHKFRKAYRAHVGSEVPSDHWYAEQKRGPKRKAPIVEEEPEKEHRELNEAEDDALKKAHYEMNKCGDSTARNPMVMKLKKSLYGLKQSGYNLDERLSSVS
ncbi:hypothetical protein NFJ02_21g45280 [Pycnococcus provasolii]